MCFDANFLHAQTGLKFNENSFPIHTTSFSDLVFYRSLNGKQAGENPVSRFDERDIIFVRVRLKQGSVEYHSSYEMQPENKEMDDVLRITPGLLSEKSRFSSPLMFAAWKENFFLTEALGNAVVGPIAGIK